MSVPASRREFMLARIQAEGPEDDPCWSWKYRLSPSQNALYMPPDENGKKTTIARAAYEEFNGPVPAGTRVCRTCANPRCIRPEHLVALTYSEERRIRREARGTASECEICIRADGTAYVRTLTAAWEKYLRRVRGSEPQGNGEFLLPRGTVRFVGIRSRDTKHQWARDSRARHGDAGQGFDPRTFTDRGWTGWKDEEAGQLGLAEDGDVG